MALDNPRDYRYLEDEYLTFIENDRIRLGINMALGGCVTYLAEKGGKNLINSHDWGRQVQLSFYGYPKPFLPEGVEISSAWEMLGWNPIGCGDAFGNRSKILDSRVTEDSIYVKCIPMHWPLDNVPGECTFETWYRLNGDRVDVTARLNSGAAILNVAAAERTPEVVRKIRQDFPGVPIIASGGGKPETILETIEAGANAITYTPPTAQELFKRMMSRYRDF